MFKLDTILAKVKRLTYTTTSWFKQWVYSLTGEQKKWYFVPQNENAPDQWFWKFWQVFKFECDNPFDVEESDRLVIDDVDYEVKAVARFTGASIDRIRCILIKSKND